MLEHSRPLTRRRRVLVTSSLAALLLFAAITVAYINRGPANRQIKAGAATVLVSSAAAKTSTTRAQSPAPASSPQFDLSRSLIAGGGGTSSNGSLRIDGAIGQPAAGTVMSGGNFAQAGGFWQPEATPTPSPTPTPMPTPTTIQFSAASYTVAESGQQVDITVTRQGNTSTSAGVDFMTDDSAAAQKCNVINGAASSRCDYETRIATIKFGPNETSKIISVFIIDDSYLEGTEAFTVNLSNPSGATLGAQVTASVMITDNDLADGPNPIDVPGFFVQVHYLDFLNRLPDNGGLQFWIGNIMSCGNDPQCADIKRINVSAAFYLSIEFQQTGYVVERLYKTAYGDASGVSTLRASHQLPVPVVRLNEFLADTQQIGQGVVVNQAGWEAVLENKKQLLAAAFVQ